MKHLSLSTVLFLLACIFITACKKTTVTNDNSDQGVSFNHLLKTIAKLNAGTGKEIITAYEYNNNNQLLQIKTTDNTGDVTQQYIETFFRNSTGKLDSIVYTGTGGAFTPYSSKTWFYYDGNEKLILSKYVFTDAGSLARKDSSIYTYNGNDLQKRTDYRSFDGGISYSLLTEAFYQFDAAGNITRSIFDWAVNPNTTDTLNFQYDNKKNPVPRAEGYFYWAPVFYNDYKMQNNLLKLTGNNVDEQTTYEYNYTPNNKPLYRKQINTSNLVYETYYYYD